MIKKLTLLVGIGAGYVLGAKAGREKYDQIVVKANDLMGKPQVQNATSSVTAAASDLADKAKSTVNDKVEAVTDKTSSATTTPAVDVTDTAVGAVTTPKAATPPPAPKSTPTTSTSPMAGAAPSVTAPDVPR